MTSDKKNIVSVIAAAASERSHARVEKLGIHLKLIERQIYVCAQSTTCSGSEYYTMSEKSEIEQFERIGET